MKIGFIGLGIMGKPMAKNLIDAGYELTVLERPSGSHRELVQLGATTASTAREVAEQTDVVITMLPDSPDVREVVLGAGGVAEGIKPGTYYVDMSSIDPLVAQEVAAALADQDIVMLDAPVSGGEQGAIDGTLSIMVGGDEAAFETLKPVFSALGKSVVRVGEVGAGNVTKLANQAIVAVNIAVGAEALVLAQKAGVDPAAVFEAIKGGLAGSNVLNAKVPVMLRHDFTPGFRTGLHLKDLANVMSTSHAVGSPMPLTAAAYELMTQLRAHGFEDEDHSALLRVYEAASNTELSAAGE